MRRVLLAVIAIALLLPAWVPVAAQDGDVELRVLSNRADLLSGGDALVEVVGPAGQETAAVSVDVAGRDVSAAFTRTADRRLIGLVEGLGLGPNVLTATLPDGSGARITLTNHAIGGPVFSGPQVQPWVCTTADAGLGEPTDEQCNAPAVFEYLYRSSESGAFAPYDPQSPPDDVAETTTDEGVTVPYVVRRERGAMNRGLYAITVLFDPSRPWTAAAPQEAWNHKLFYPFGASCNTNYHQGAADDATLRDEALSRGFAVATSTLNILGQNCNTVTSAEAVMMLKEHLVERYGEVRYTFGDGGSGGSIGQLTVTNAYPGLLQGLIPSATYPDVWTTLIEVQDCHLLVAYYALHLPLWLDPADQTAVNGHMGPSVCAAWEATFAPVQDPAHGCGLEMASAVPPGSVRTPGDYHAVLNPEGCRSTIQDLQAGVWGRRAEDGFARLPYDNEGVQYGLRALSEGAISTEQFVDLNTGIGGLDVDHNLQPQRSVGDPGTPLIGHASAQVNDGRGLAGTAIIDLPAEMNVEIHTPFHAFSIEERLAAAHGHADNHAIWRGGPGALAFETMDAWLAAVEADPSTDPLEEKVVRNRPGAAVDSCFIDGEQVTDVAACDAAWPYFGDARIAAGSPLASDRLSCALTPPDRASYGVEFTDAQWELLEEAFPTGVCDWSRPGEGQVPSRQWVTFAEGPGGRPLGPAPVSVPFGPAGAAVARHAGPGRLETAVAVSAAAVAAADTVVIARADAYADALAGGPLAAVLEAPLLLSRSDVLPGATADEVRRLGAAEAVLLGGEAALGPQVAADLEALGLDVRRVAGADRFATAAAIAAELAPASVALVARGDAFPDALSASGLASALRVPVLLVEPGRLPDATMAALTGDQQVLVVGGPAAVSEEVVAALPAATVTRVAGANRYATSAAVAREALARGIGAEVTWVATGADFPDALVAGAAAGRDRALLVLVDGHDLEGSPETASLLDTAAIAELRITGGAAAITDTVAADLAARARAGPAGRAERVHPGGSGTAFRRGRPSADVAPDPRGYVALEVAGVGGRHDDVMALVSQDQ